MTMLLPLLMCVAVAVLILGLVAIPARRAGRDLLSARGEEVLVRVRSEADAAATKTSDLVNNAASRMRSGGSGES